MKEIEVKILGIDSDDIRAKLAEFGAEKTFDGLLRVRYFDTPDGEIRKNGDLLRVRDYDGKKVEITHKTNKRIENGFKIFDEQNVEAEDFEETTKMFKELGFVVTTYYEKKRAVFKLDSAEIVIDEYPKIPPFLEIEAEDEQVIEDFIEKLGLKDNERSSHTINELLKEKYPHIELNNLKF
jgi:adenylate cyclase class 2